MRSPRTVCDRLKLLVIQSVPLHGLPALSGLFRRSYFGNNLPSIHEK